MTCLESAWRAYADELQSFVCRQLGDGDAALDISQEVFLKAVKLGRSFCDLKDPRAWLYSVARNAIIDWIRSHHARRFEPLDELAEELPNDDSAALVAPVAALVVCLPRALSRLSMSDLEVIVRCDLDRLTVKAYSEERQLSLPAAKTRLRRARERLRKHLVRDCRIKMDRHGRVYDFARFLVEGPTV